MDVTHQTNDEQATRWNGLAGRAWVEGQELLDQVLKPFEDLLLEAVSAAKPGSRVLDVGCGTGQVAAALESYLSDRGVYYGTELAKEGVEFCRRRYRRPNFHFAQNEMTSLPLQGLQFDLVVFFSVFTHTYPEETAQLLAEAKRLMAPGGCILADVFTSPMVERHAGNRGALEVNLEHLMHLAREKGLNADEVLCFPWQSFGRRRLFKFMAA